MTMPLIVANWKMNPKWQDDAQQLTLGVRQELEDLSGVRIVVCPPSLYLTTVRDCLAGCSLHLGAQNMHHEIQGAYTGEISATMLKDIYGLKPGYVILGHSERREYFSETDGMVGLKVTAAIKHDIRPILCVGETLEERQRGEAEKVVHRQLVEGLVDLTIGPVGKGAAAVGMAVAYEPVWAIGTGVAATPETAQEIMGGVIRSVLTDLFGETEASNIALLYGGSVNPANAESFMAQPAIDGALVGGASLKPKDFADIVRITARVKTLS
jgi:triosephosphate isomerase